MNTTVIYTDLSLTHETHVNSDCMTSFSVVAVITYSTSKIFCFCFWISCHYFFSYGTVR